MTDPFKILNEAELDHLNQFLLDRIPEDADDDYTEDTDEGILDVSELDGFFTAVVSSPVMIPPSQWLPAVWGEYEPEWESEKEFENIFTLLMRHMNDIATTLMEQPEYFEALFQERVVKGKTYAIVDEWCEGYLRGVALAAIEPNVREIHAYWLERRSEDVSASQPVRRSEPRVGRNDPCPCGSGKKYKKCCLH